MCRICSILNVSIYEHIQTGQKKKHPLVNNVEQNGVYTEKIERGQKEISYCWYCLNDYISASVVIQVIKQRLHESSPFCFHVSDSDPCQVLSALGRSSFH